MSDKVLAQLQQVDAELSAQEEQLVAQIETLQEKRNGIRTVIEMYSEKTDEPEAASSDAAKPKGSAPAKKAVKSSTTKKAAGSKGAKTEKKVKTATAKKSTTKKSTTKQQKKDGRTATWQKYTRPGVKNESIPDAVQLVLETQPGKDFKIAEVMAALFKENMPKGEYLKARNRISNVLSGGVRAGDWFKGARGTYRMTAA